MSDPLQYLTLEKSDGGRYVGYVKMNTHIRQGHGVYTSPRGTYDGTWCNDKRHGDGVYTFTNGEVYSGNWHNGYMHGVGTFSWTNGESYSGGFNKGTLEGQGKKVLSNGDIYVGEWRNNQSHGWGVKTYTNGDSHEGHFVGDVRHGYGRYTWQNGEVYEGEWHNGAASGKGRKTMVNGERYEGEWLDDLAHGHGTKTFANGDTHEGEYQQNLRNGFGVYKWRNGESVHGFWINGVQSLRGTYYYEAGNVFCGFWVEGKKHGRALYIDQHDRCFEEFWKNGERASQTPIRHIPKRLLRTLPAHARCNINSDFGPIRDDDNDKSGLNSSTNMNDSVYQPQPQQPQPSLLNLQQSGPRHASFPLDTHTSFDQNNTTLSMSTHSHTHSLSLDLSASSPLLSPEHTSHMRSLLQKQQAQVTTQLSLLDIETEIQKRSDANQDVSALIVQRLSLTLELNKIDEEIQQLNSKTSACAPMSLPLLLPHASLSSRTTESSLSVDGHYDTHTHTHARTDSVLADDADTTCRICCTNEANCVLIPCGHLGLCMSCSDRLDRCSVCRSNIHDVIKIYRA